MATERLLIQIDERGARVVQRDLAKIGDSAKQSEGPVKLLRGALATLGVAFLAKEILSLADTFQRLQNRLRVVTDGQEQLTRVTQSLFDVSQRTRSSFESNVELYSRLAISTRELGLSEQQLVGFTESLNQAIALSGATAAEASAGIIQLSQGIASGTLRGDELRSVLEQLPAVADVIAKSLGVTRGQLRLLGEAGKITGKDIVIAFQEARGELAEGFGKTVPTVGQAFQVLRNSLIKIAEADLTPLTSAITDLAEQITDPAFQDGFAKLVGGLVKIAGLAFEGLSSFGTFGDSIAATIASATGNLSEMDELEIKIKELDAAINNSFMGKPIKFLFTDKAELERLKSELETQRQSIINTFNNTPGASAAGAGTAAVPMIDRGPPPIDPKLIKDQQEFIDKLRETATELRIQVTEGDNARAALERYATEQEIVALQLGPQMTAQARALTEEIIAQRVALEATEAVAERGEFTLALQQQAEALRVQIEAGDGAADALLRYETAVEAATLGDAAFVTETGVLINEVIRQRDALEQATQARERMKENDELIQALEAESSLIGMTNRQRAIEIELRKLSAEATAEQRTQVMELAGELFDEQNALKSQFITIDQLVRDLVTNTQQTLSGVLFEAMTDGIDDIPERFGNMLKRLAADFAASQFTKMISNIGSEGGFFQSMLSGNGGGFQAGGGGWTKGAGFFKNLAGLFGGGFAGKFANGGGFTVPGSGAPDSKLVSMLLSPRERVDVTPAGRNRPSGGSVVHAPMTFLLPESAMRGGAELRETQAQVAAAAFGALGRASRRSR